MRREPTLGKILRTTWLLTLAVGLGACGSDTKKTPDAAAPPDTAKTPDLAQNPDVPPQPDTSPTVVRTRVSICQAPRTPR
jgi:hypothetical protein